mmetsp:Transcript_103679/g.299904  ORF Transcript_103679/g.299904 Transcript_103679/m.299904 type:complete len:99 (-) Transcript_103679:888-1184(-)
MCKSKFPTVAKKKLPLSSRFDDNRNFHWLDGQQHCMNNGIDSMLRSDGKVTKNMRQETLELNHGHWLSHAVSGTNRERKPIILLLQLVSFVQEALRLE